MDSFGFSSSNESVLVAVSGGVDSMVLATLMYENGFTIAVAHCNYQLRGADSDLDEKLVRDWCAQLQIPFHSKKVPTQRLAAETNDSVQMVARKARYAFFTQLMKEHGYVTTALAHNLDDRIESLLINVLRGTGFRGLQGMPSRRKGLIRPLLGISKQEIRAYAEKAAIPFREDASNTQTYYLRNWVRLRLLPILNQIDPAALFKLQKLTERVELALPEYEKWIQERLSEARSDNGLSTEALLNSNAPFTLLKELLKSKGFSSDQVFEVLDIMDSESGREVASETHKVIKDREQLILAEKDALETKPRLQFELLDRNAIGTLNARRNVALLDAGLIGFSSVQPKELDSALVLRKWKLGDRFKPLGMKGWKKLSDYFIDVKLSTLEKEKVWLLTHGNEIVWVVGHRVDDRFKVSDTTTSVLKVTMVSAE